MWTKSLACFLSAAACWLMPASLVPPEFSLLRSFPVNAEIITIDNLGNVFALNRNTIRKYSPEGQLLEEFTNNAVDSYTNIDASDPFKILLFSKSSAEISRVDNKLTPQGNTTSLSRIDLVAPTLACNSYEGGCWIWDNSLAEIVRINQNSTIEQRTGNLTSVLGFTPAFHHILEKDFLLYASDEKEGILIFDRYGNFVKKIPLAGIADFQVINSKILYPSNDSLFTFDPASFLETSVNLPMKKSPRIIVHNKLLYCHHSDSIFVFSTNIPL